MPDINTSGIYKIDGYRLLAASSQRALGDSNGDDITATYLKKADFTDASGKWENAADAVATNSGNWNKVSAKLDTSAFEAWSAGKDFDAYTAGANIDITNHVVSGKDWTTDITNTADAASANAVSVVEGKFGLDSDNEITGYNGSAFAGEEYTAGDGIDITNNKISVTGKYVTSATAASATDKLLVLHNNAWVELPDTEGGYLTANSAAGGVPDVATGASALKYIYLVKDGTATGKDKYNEWIFTSADASTTAWEKIGDTSIDLNDYATTAWVDGHYVSTAATGSWDVTSYTGTNGISIANHSVELAPAYKTAVEDVSSKLNTSDFEAWSGAATTDITPYTAGANIDITNHVVSGKDWTTEIQAASSNAITTVGNNFATSSDGTNTYITSYNNSAFYTPDMSEYVTTSVYNTNSAVWQNAASCLSANSGAWTHAFTVINVPDLANIPDATPSNNSEP